MFDISRSGETPFSEQRTVVFKVILLLYKSCFLLLFISKNPVLHTSSTVDSETSVALDSLCLNFLTRIKYARGITAQLKHPCTQRPKWICCLNIQLKLADLTTVMRQTLLLDCVLHFVLCFEAQLISLKSVRLMGSSASSYHLHSLD
jgi:hypothetical protein